MSVSGDESVGDNIEFTAVDIDDYTIWLSLKGIDTATKKFSEHPLTARKFVIRADKSIDLVTLNNLTFTDPVQITADQTHTENRNVQAIFKMVLRTTATNTAIKLRWF